MAVKASMEKRNDIEGCLLLLAAQWRSPKKTASKAAERIGQLKKTSKGKVVPRNKSKQEKQIVMCDRWQVAAMLSMCCSCFAVNVPVFQGNIVVMRRLLATFGALSASVRHSTTLLVVLSTKYTQWILTQPTIIRGLSSAPFGTQTRPVLNPWLRRRPPALYSYSHCIPRYALRSPCSILYAGSLLKDPQVTHKDGIQILRFVFKIKDELGVHIVLRFASA